MAAIDLFESNSPGLNAPAKHAAAIVPHATDELAFVTRAIWVGGVGSVVAKMLDGTIVTFTAVPAGTLLPIRAKAIVDTSTATLMIAMW